MPTAASLLRTRIPGRAPLVWRRALDLAADPASRHDQLALALDLLRTAQHDPAVIREALRLGKAQLWAHSNDRSTVQATGILEAAMAFLGITVHVRTGVS